MPSIYTQDNRPLAVKTPLGKDVLLLVSFSGHEAVSELFSFELELVADNEQVSQVKFDALLGQAVDVLVKGPAGGERHFHGMCSRVGQGDSDKRFTRFRMTVVPKVWTLTRVARSRVFQSVSVPDILKTVLTGHDVQWQIQGTYEPRDYCVQYRETDFQFASRLMEEEGIFYFFVHSDGAHKMVVTDVPTGHPDLPDPVAVPYESVAGGTRDEERVRDWEKSQELRSGKVAFRDHCFEMPDKTLDASSTVAATVAVGKVTHKTDVGGNSAFELYDYPGGYAGRFDGISPGGGDRASDLGKISQDGTRTSKIRIEQETAPAIAVQGASNCVRFSAGHRFELKEHGDADGRYVLTRVHHRISAGAEYATGEAGGDDEPYANTFGCIPAALVFRPQRTTPRPVVHGAQSAVVVGPSGEEIFTDKYGRIRVQFPWDRDGKKDGAATCWVRVGTHWAGTQWGAVHIPRIGQEVIVDFLEGDPDQPIVVGSVYNASQMPPYALPDNRTQSGLKSRSSPKGTAENFNELRFEDKKDAEEIYFHAEKNFKRVVENDDVLEVGLVKKDKGDQTITIQNSRTETVKEGDETVTIEKGKRTVTVKTGDDLHQVEKGKRTVLVDTGDDTHTIAKGNRSVEVSMGNDDLKIKTGNRTTKIDLGKSSTEAMQSIELKVGQSSILIDQTGVTIKGMTIKVEATMQLQAKGMMTDVKADAILTAKGALTMIG